MLNHEGVEFVLIGAADDAEEELGIRFDVEREDAESADIFERLRMPRETHPSEPLTEGEWR
jgi:hypothetical protein